MLLRAYRFFVDAIPFYHFYILYSKLLMAAIVRVKLPILRRLLLLSEESSRLFEGKLRSIRMNLTVYSDISGQSIWPIYLENLRLLKK